MKYLLSVLLFFPLLLFSQQLPDSALAAKAGVKKLIITRSQNDTLLDTIGIYNFNGKWSLYLDAVVFPKAGPVRLDSNRIYMHDQNGNLIWDARIQHSLVNGKSITDTSGYQYHYNKSGQLIQSRAINILGQGTVINSFYYDSHGHRILKVCSSTGIRIDINRTEYTYADDGKLLSVTEWHAEFPEQESRGKQDIIRTKVEYFFDPSGLIVSMQAYDPLHRSYCMEIQRNKKTKIRGAYLTYKYHYIF